MPSCAAAGTSCLQGAFYSRFSILPPSAAGSAGDGTQVLSLALLPAELRAPASAQPQQQDADASETGPEASGVAAGPGQDSDAVASAVASSGSLTLQTASARGSNSGPRIALVTTPALGGVVEVPRGVAYGLCGPGQMPTAERPCELGARAWDVEDGDLTPMVTNS